MPRRRTTISFEYEATAPKVDGAVAAIERGVTGAAVETADNLLIVATDDRHAGVDGVKVETRSVPEEWPAGSIVLLTGGHAEHVQIAPERLAALVRKSREAESFLRVQSSTTPGFLGFFDALEVCGIKPATPGSEAHGGATPGR